MENNLTGQELETLKHLRFGLENSDIAKVMFVSKASVKAYISSLIFKLNARNRTHALYVGLKRGLIE